MEVTVIEHNKAEQAGCSGARARLGSWELVEREREGTEEKMEADDDDGALDI